MSEDQKTTADRFEIVFKELEKATSFVNPETGVLVILPDSNLAELREIDELRRVAMEVATPRQFLLRVRMPSSSVSMIASSASNVSASTIAAAISMARWIAASAPLSLCQQSAVTRISVSGEFDIGIGRGCCDSRLWDFFTRQDTNAFDVVPLQHAPGEFAERVAD